MIRVLRTDSLDDLKSFDCRDLVPQCSHANIVVTSTLSQNMKILDFQGQGKGELDLTHGWGMLPSDLGAGARLDKDMRVLKPSRRFSDLGLSFRNSNRNHPFNGWVASSDWTARSMVEQGNPVRDFLGNYETQYRRKMGHRPARGLGTTKRTCRSWVLSIRYLRDSVKLLIEKHLWQCGVKYKTWHWFLLHAHTHMYQIVGLWYRKVDP